MLHLTTITLVCCAVSAPSEGIAVVRRKNYLLDGFCPLERRVPKATGDSFSADNINDEHFSDRVKQKVTYSPSFFYNCFINQYQSKKNNNYCSVMDSVLGKTKKQSGSSVKLAYRKRNLLWTQKTIKTLKTLQKKKECSTTTQTPVKIGKCNLNVKEKKGFFVLKRGKKVKVKKLKECCSGRKPICETHFEPKNQHFFLSEPIRRLSRGNLNGNVEGKMRHSPPFPRFHKRDSRVECKRSRNSHVDSVLKSVPQNRRSSGEQANQISYSSPNVRHSSSLVSKRRFESFRPADAKKLKIGGYSPSSEMNVFLRPDFNEKFVQKHKTQRLNENFNAAESSREFHTSYDALKKSFLRHTKTEIPIVDFDFPDYDEASSKDYAPVHIHRRRAFKLSRSGLSDKRHPKIRRQLRSDTWHRLDLKRSLPLTKIRRKKKCPKLSNSCESPHKCWRSAPLLCIPYIRKGQDDLLKYLIQIMQKLLNKPHPHKIEIFENIKFKPFFRKHNSGSCEDILPQDSDEYDDDSSDTNKTKSAQDSCDPCLGQNTVNPKPQSNTPAPAKNLSEPVCPSFPFSLPYLNQIYTEPTPCDTDKCFSTLPPFMFPFDTKKLSSPPLPPPKASSSPSTRTKSTVTTAKSPSPKPVKLVSTPKANSVKVEKNVNLNLFGDGDQARRYQELNDKLIPKFTKLKEEMKALNITESTFRPSNESFLHKLPTIIGGSPNLSNPHAIRDLHNNGNSSLLSEDSPDIFNKTNQKPHLISPNKRPRKRKIHHFTPTNGTDVYRSLSKVSLQRNDESQIDKPPFHSRQRAWRSVKRKNSESVKRQKRENDIYADDLLNYDGYELYNAERHDEDREPLHRLNRKGISSDVNEFADDDNSWTTLNFEMFKELAKMVTTEENTSDDELDQTTPEPKATVVTEDQPMTSSVCTENPSNLTSSNEPTKKPAVTDETRKSEAVTESRQRKKDSESGKVRKPSTFGSWTQDNGKERKLASTKPTPPEEGQFPTTMRTASLVRGPKRKLTKPSPKVYAKVYPDCVAADNEGNCTTISPATESTPKRKILLKATPTMATATADVRLQLLAVCEGYLEVVKFMKSQNKSLGDDLDSDLYSYCENIISQSFSQQTESSKPKKADSGLSGTGEEEDSENAQRREEESVSDSVPYNSFDDPVLKRDLLDSEKSQTEKSKTRNGKKDENSEEDDDEFLQKGMTKGQMELLNLLKKKKRNLLNWLLNPKEQTQSETVEDEDYEDSLVSRKHSFHLRNRSDTIRPRGAKGSRTTAKVDTALKENSGFPVYAKRYGYDQGGQLKQVEVLWRKVDGKTHEKKIFKNMSVLALVLTSTAAPRVINEDDSIVNLDQYFNEETESKNKMRLGLAAKESNDGNNKSETEKTEATTKAVSHTKKTVVYVNKPDPSSLIGTSENTTNTAKHRNLTQKMGEKINKAEEVVEEYTVQFWTYAAYILPITFTILFLFCCACIAVRSFRKGTSKRRKKKGKKIESTSEETTDDTEDSEDVKKDPDKDKKSKKIWNAWKKYKDKPASDEEGKPSETKKSILRFIKGKKNDKSEAGPSVPYSALTKDDEPKEDAENEAAENETAENEAAERRELITLLEELKKIEMEHVGEKKEQKSVHVQYMIQDSDESAFKRSNMHKGYPWYNTNFPFHHTGSPDFGVYTDSELCELLPCECDLYSKKRDCLRKCNFRLNDGQCDRLFKIFRNTNVCHHELANAKRFTNKEKNFLFDKYRSADRNDVTNEMSFTHKARETPSFNPPQRNPNDWIGEVEHFNRQILKKKHVRLKDDGVLCRL